MTRFTIAALLIFALASAATPARADYRAGIAAYQAGRYEQALKEFQPLAERGVPGAEFMLGVMYFYGKGVVRDASVAAVWFYKAASKGDPNGQLAFGSLHIRGTGVRRDLVKAYMWLTLAAQSEVAGLQQQAILLRDDASHLMTPEEVEKAQQLAADFEPTSAGLTSGD